MELRRVCNVCLIFFVIVSFILVSTQVRGDDNQSLQEVPNFETYIIETIGPPDYLDPATNYETGGSGMNEQVCETLADFEGNSAELQGRLATTWGPSVDGIMWTFNLRTGVTFTDGTPFNAYVMKYSIDRTQILSDPSGPAWLTQDVIVGAHGLGMLDDINVSEALDYLAKSAVKVVDEFTITINITSPAPLDQILQYRSSCAVSPKQVAMNAPSVYTNFTNSLTNAENESAQVPLNLWFPGLNGDFNKLGLTGNWNNTSGVVPGGIPDSSMEHTGMDLPVGTGPYLYVSVSENEVKLDKNVNWWGKDSYDGKTDNGFHANAADHISWRVVEESATRLVDLRAGNADQAGLDAAQRLEILASTNGIFNQPFRILDSSFQIYSAPATCISSATFNMNNTIPATFLQQSGGHYNVTHNKNGTPRNLYRYNDPSLGLASQENPFTSVLFRKAFAHSLNVEALILIERHGLGFQPSGVVPKGFFGYVDDLIENGYIPEYSPEKARIFFEEVGWEGVISLMNYGGNTFRKQIFLLLKDVIEGLGIGIRIDVSEALVPGYLWDFFDHNIPIQSRGKCADYADAHNFVVPFYHGVKGSFATRTSYNNTYVNDLIDNAILEQNKNKRIEMYRWIEQNATQDYPMIYTLQSIGALILRSWIENVPESGALHAMRNPAPPIHRLGKPAVWDPTTVPVFSTIISNPSTTPTLDSNPYSSTIDIDEIDKRAANSRFLFDIIISFLTIALGSSGGVVLAIIVRRIKN